MKRTRSCGEIPICANGPAETTSSVWLTRRSVDDPSPAWPNSMRSSFCVATSMPAAQSTVTAPASAAPVYSDRNPAPLRPSSMLRKAPTAFRSRHMPQPVTRKRCVSLKRCSSVRPPCPWPAASPQPRAAAIPRAMQAPATHSPFSRTGSVLASARLRKLGLSANGES